MEHLKDKIGHVASGEPGTTGREPFEDGSAASSNAQFSSTGTKEGTGIVGAPGLTSGEGHHHHHHHHEGHHSHDQHGDHHHHSAGNTGAVGSLPEAGHHGHGHDGKYSGVGEHGSNQFGGIANVGNTGTTGSATGLGSGTGAGLGGERDRHAPATREGGAGTTQYDNDRVGALEQGNQKYERTGLDGPATGGAPGTDRFDTSAGESRPGVGNTREGAAGDVTERAHDKGTGGVGGILSTTDKEFTGRDRLGGAGGAYGDEAGHYKANTSGPAGNTALTGREGTIENNPVAQAKSRAGEDVHDVHGASNPGVGSTAHPEHQKKGLMEKVKDALT